MHIRLITLLWVILSVSACTVNPVTGKSQLNFMSPEQEVAIGSNQYQPAQQSQGGRYIVDADINVYVSSVGKKLAAVSDRPGLPYEFVVLNNDVPNAWALPGGKISINRGLLVALKDEAQLAAVLAHEIVHAAAAHGATQMTQQTLLGIGTQVLGVAAQSSEFGGLINQGGQLGSALWLSQYGQSHELEADDYGMTYMAKAGYDPVAAVELQEYFVTLSEGQNSNWLAGLFASHPPSRARVAANKAKAATLSGSIRNKAQFDKALAKLVKDQPAYTAHQQALAAVAKEDLVQANNLVAKAIKLQPNEALFYITQGKLALTGKDFTSAEKSFDKAVKTNPDYFLGYLGRGLAAKQLQRTDQAFADLQTSQKWLATPLAAYHLGTIYESRGDNANAVTQYQLAAQAGGDLGAAANQRVQAITQAQVQGQ